MASSSESGTAPVRRKRVAKKAVTVIESADLAPLEMTPIAHEPAPTAPTRTRAAAAASAYALDPAPPQSSFLTRGTVRSSDVTAFLRQLIMMLDAGMPILRSLKTLSKRGERAAARALVADITGYVEQGNTLWQAFDRHPRYFDTVFVSLIKAAEASGTLTTVLRRMVDYRESRELMIKRVRGAMIYPVVLLIACMGVLWLLTYFVVPEFKAMFEKAGLDIPNYTQVFLNVSDAIASYFWVPIAVLIVLIVVYNVWWIRSPLRRLTSDRLKLKIPVIGKILHKNAIVEMTRTMALLLRSGLSMMSTLELARAAIHNRAVAEALQGVRDSVEQGGGMEEPLRRAYRVIPPVVTDMFVTGEETGKVDAIAEQIASIYEEEVEIAVNTIGELLQPIFTVIIGVAVMGLFFCLFLPLVSMIEQISSAGV